MNDFVSKVMKTIASIQQHIEKNGTGDVVEKQCQDHSSCQEIVEYLNNIDEANVELEIQAKLVEK